MSEMKSLTLNNGETYDCFVDSAARVICSASGKSISVSDSSDLGLVGLNINGRSTQDGTPTPTVPSSIISVGGDGRIRVGVQSATNVLPKTFLSGGLEKETGAEMADDTLQRTEYLPCGGNVTYSVTGQGGPLRAFFYNANKTFLSTTYLILGDWFTTPANCAFVRFHVALTNYNAALRVNSVDSVTMDNLILRGVPVTNKSLATYTDANGQMWYADELDFDRGVYVQRAMKLQLTSSMTWQKNNSGTEIYTSLESIGGVMKTENSPVLCSHFVKGAWGVTKAGQICLGNGISSLLGISTASFPTVDGLKSWLDNAADGVFCVIPRATPIEIPLPAEVIAAYKALHTNKPSTTIVNDENAYMTVKYIADSKSYIDNRIASAILTATVE